MGLLAQLPENLLVAPFLVLFLVLLFVVLLMILQVVFVTTPALLPIGTICPSG